MPLAYSFRKKIVTAKRTEKYLIDAKTNIDEDIINGNIKQFKFFESKRTYILVSVGKYNNGFEVSLLYTNKSNYIEKIIGRSTSITAIHK